MNKISITQKKSYFWTISSNLMTCLFVVTMALFIMNSCVNPRRQDTQTSNSGSRNRSRTIVKGSSSPSSVRMRKSNDVYLVPCKINGVEMDFIFDTGAADITMSLTEARFLYKQGKLVEDDFIGVAQYQIADGSISEGMVVNLRSVEIGGRTLQNVQASIVDNDLAPLLLGQSALSQFGKISIDYNALLINFE